MLLHEFCTTCVHISHMVQLEAHIKLIDMHKSCHFPPPPTTPITLCDITANRNFGFMSSPLLTTCVDSACTFLHFGLKWFKPLHFLYTLPHAGWLVFLHSYYNSYSLVQSLVFHSYLESCFLPCWEVVQLPPVSPTDLWPLDVTLAMCVPAISFVCLLMSLYARQMFVAFCRSSIFSHRSSSCTLPVTESGIFWCCSIHSFISSKLHRFAWDLTSVSDESDGSWQVMFQKRCVFMTFVQSWTTVLSKLFQNLLWIVFISMIVIKHKMFVHVLYLNTTQCRIMAVYIAFGFSRTLEAF